MVGEIYELSLWRVKATGVQAQKAQILLPLLGVAQPALASVRPLFTLERGRGWRRASRSWV